MPARDELPETLKRSPKKAQETWTAVHDNAAREYGDGERAHRTAIAALKHTYQKVDDHWERKKAKGPSDPRSTHHGRAARDGRGESFGGVDYFGSTKAELMARARDLEIRGRSTMNKADLARAIARKQG